MKGWVEPEPALGGEVRLIRQLHIGDQKAVLKNTPLALQPQHLPRGRACAVAGHQPLRVDLVRALGRVDAEQCAVRAALHRSDLVVPADVDARQLQRTLHQVGLGVVLLKVDEGGALVALFGQQVELVQLLVLQKHLAQVPRHALVHHALAHAQAVPDLQRALGKADGARADGELVVVVQHHHTLPALGQVDRQRQAHGARADDHDGVLRGRRAVLVRRAHISKIEGLHLGATGVEGFGGNVSGVHIFCLLQPRRLSLPKPSTFGYRARRSRCAGRGTALPRRRPGSRQTACSG